MELICSDCAMWAANRDDSGNSAEWNNRADASQFVVDSERIHTFVTSPCDSCGSHLAGTRFEATRF